MWRPSGECASGRADVARGHGPTGGVALVAERPDVTSLELTVQYYRRVPKVHRAHRSSVLRALYRAGFEPRPMNWGNNLTMIGAVRRCGWVTLATLFKSANRERFVDWASRDFRPLDLSR